MKLPWDKTYLKISFHVIFTLLVVCIVAIISYNIIPIFKAIFGIIGKLFSVFSPLWIGLIIAYLLDPIAEYFQKKGKEFLNKNQSNIDKFKKNFRIKLKPKNPPKYRTRALGTSLTYIVILISIILISMLISFSFGNSGGSDNIKNITVEISNTLNSFTSFLSNMQNKLGEFGVSEQLDSIVQKAISEITSFTTTLGNQLVSSISKAGGFIVNFVLGVVVAFYCLKDKEMILFKTKDISDLFIPKKANSFIKIILSDIDAVFSGYIRGQLTDAFIMAILISVALSLIGIDFSVLIGVVSGFTNIIPYIGAFVGLALAVIVGLLSGTPIKALIALVVILILQQVDGAVISPKVLGDQVDLHPVLILLALSIGGSLFGLVGMILAVPVTAILKIFLSRYTERKKKQLINKNNIC